MDINLDSVKRLKPEPGDTLVLRVGQPVDDATFAELQHQMAVAFPGHKTLVLAGDLELEVVSPPPGA